MENFKPEEYARVRTTLEGWDVCITSYRLRDVFYCKIDNVDPGATIARAQGGTRDEAEGEAMRKASARLALTRRIRVTREALTAVQASVQILSAELEELERASQAAANSDPEATPVAQNRQES
jgi:hypothetical protein